MQSGAVGCPNSSNMELDWQCALETIVRKNVVDSGIMGLSTQLLKIT